MSQQISKLTRFFPSVEMTKTGIFVQTLINGLLSKLQNKIAKDNLQIPNNNQIPIFNDRNAVWNLNVWSLEFILTVL